MEANLKATAILDYKNPSIQQVAAEIRARELLDHSFLATAHRFLADEISPVYTLDELQPASVTYRKQRGSCSQRTACLEAVARAGGIPTRARVLQISGRFWYPRFTWSRSFIPRRILLVWPQFFLKNAWMDFDEIHSSAGNVAIETAPAFTNDGESLFDAVAHTFVDFFGKTRRDGCGPSACDLSRFVLKDDGIFDTRDEVFEHFGSFQHTLRGRAFEILFGGRKSG